MITIHFPLFRKIIFCFLILCVSLPASLFAADMLHSEVDGKKITIPSDGREWKAGFDNDDGKKWIMEYFLPDETLDSWTELITLNYIRGSNDPQVLDRFMDFTEKGVRSQCQDVKWKVISKKENAVLYSWTAAICSEGWEDQSEIARAVRGEKGLFVLHYASKTVPLSSEKQAAWTDSLDKASIA